MFNLNEDATWSVNLKAFKHNKTGIFGFPDHGPFYGPSMFINGANSFQRPIQSIDHYRGFAPNVKTADVIEVPCAGHGVHFDQPAIVANYLHNFLLSNLVQDQVEPVVSQVSLAL